MNGRAANLVLLCTSKGIMFLLGLMAGFLMDLVPSWVMSHWNIPFCAESCPTWLSGFSLVAYAGIPVVLAFSAAVFCDPLARIIRPKPLLITLAAAAVILAAGAWMTYAYAVRII